jgi:dienelactone hydrolase
MSSGYEGQIAETIAMAGAGGEMIEAYLAACTADGLDAAVDCWGGRVIVGPEGLNERQPRAPIDFTPQMRTPLLGIFGNEDANPDAEQVDRIEAELRRRGSPLRRDLNQRYGVSGRGAVAGRPAGRRSRCSTRCRQRSVQPWMMLLLAM